MPRGKVKRVIDGDTFQLKSGEYVRIVGLNSRDTIPIRPTRNLYYVPRIPRNQRRRW